MPRVSVSEGVELAYDRQGEGRSVVLLHGITQNRLAWGPLVDLLAGAGFDVLALDLRGHGESARSGDLRTAALAHDVKGVLEQLRIERPLLVGHGLGAAIAAHVASRRVPRGVVFIDQPMRLDEFKRALGALEPVLRGDDATCRSTLRAMFTSLDGPLLSPDERARLDAQCPVEREVVLGVWREILEADPASLAEQSRSVMSAFDAPLLSLHGSEPGAEYRAWLKSVHAAATVEVWPEHGHNLHLVEPEKFVARVGEFDRPLVP